MIRQELRDWYRAAPGYWFRPKLFGWGAVPVTWQGWAMTAVFVVLTSAVMRLGAEDNRALLALLAPLIVSFVLLCRAKTDGAWKWRWGADS